MPNPKKTGTVRIIAGEWRSRHIKFPEAPELRPTQDQVRETLFNWLSLQIKDADCLDVFAGSGALGFEALSRGAASVTFVENSKVIIDCLKENITKFHVEDRVNLVYAAFPKQIIALPKKQYDIVFLDPPYNQGLIEPACNWLEQSAYLKPTSLIFIECERRLLPLPIPSNWTILKEKRKNNVAYYLAQSWAMGLSSPS